MAVSLADSVALTTPTPHSHARTDSYPPCADVSREEAATAEVRGAIDKLRLDSENLPRDVDAMHSEESKAKEELREVEAEAEALARENAHSTDELTKGIQFYKRIGLEFENCPDEDGEESGDILLTFTKVDPADHAREFSFKVHVTPDNAYEGKSRVRGRGGVAFERTCVCACLVRALLTSLGRRSGPRTPCLSPPCTTVTSIVPDVGPIDDLLDHVNATNDFSLFVRSMRKKFVATLSSA